MPADPAPFQDLTRLNPVVLRTKNPDIYRNSETVIEFDQACFTRGGEMDSIMGASYR